MGAQQTVERPDDRPDDRPEAVLRLERQEQRLRHERTQCSQRWWRQARQREWVHVPDGEQLQRQSAAAQRQRQQRRAAYQVEYGRPLRVTMADLTVVEPQFKTYQGDQAFQMLERGRRGRQAAQRQARRRQKQQDLRRRTARLIPRGRARQPQPRHPPGWVEWAGDIVNGALDA